MNMPTRPHESARIENGFHGDAALDNAELYGTARLIRSRVSRDAEGSSGLPLDGSRTSVMTKIGLHCKSR